jgi:hypothetical protein
MSLPLNTAVKRGPHWHTNDNRDGGSSGRGLVIEPLTGEARTGYCTVLWELSGVIADHKCGASDQFEVVAAESDAQGASAVDFSTLFCNHTL